MAKSVIYATFPSAEGLRAKLKSIPNAVASSALEKGLLMSAQACADRMRAYIQASPSIRTSDLLNAIKAKLTKGGEGFRLATAGPSGKRIRYAHLIELGHKSRDGSHVPAEPFVAPAFFDSQPTFEKIIKEQIGLALDAALKGKG